MAAFKKMNRRDALKMLAAGWGGVLLGTSGRAGAQRGSKKRPNIVFIIADDMGWADVGYHGSEIKTPHIDNLAKKGVTFGQHYVMPTCTPTRVGLMTGRFPSRYGVLSPAYGQIFDADTVTLGTALGAAGYDTSISGKWHMGSPPDCVPRKYGFKTSYGYFDGQIDPYTHLYKDGRRCWHRNDELVDEEGHATDLISDEAVRVIETKRDTPFFLEISSVSSSYNFGASIGANGDAATDPYFARVNPGLSFTERPSISYAPLQGEKFVKQLLSPLSLETLVLMYHSGWSVERVFNCCVQRLNGVRNAFSASGPIHLSDSSIRRTRSTCFLISARSSGRGVERSGAQFSFSIVHKLFRGPVRC